MCGRFVRHTNVHELTKFFGCPPPAWVMPPNYNVAPTQQVPVVRLGADGDRELVSLRWGLIPSWATDHRTSLVNARSESVASKPAFRNAFKSRRCLMPADGYYEWKKEGKVKQPYFFHRRDGKPFAFAALWEWWKKDAEPIQSCALLTTDANQMAAEVHDRMPVILPAQAFEVWLDPKATPEQLQKLLHPPPEDLLETYPVSRGVNVVKTNGPQCIEPLSA